MSQFTPSAIQNNLTTAALTAFALGSFLIMAGMAVYKLVRRGIRDLFPHGLLFGTVVMLSLSTIIVFSSSLAYTLYSYSAYPDKALSGNLSLVTSICGDLNYLLSDLIVVWRAWVLLVHRRSRIALGIIFLITVGCTTTACVLTVAMARLSQLKWLSSMNGNIPVALLIGPLIATNVIATAVVGYKTWIYRTKIKVHLQQQDRRRTVENILILFIESGSVYCAIFIFGLCNAIRQALLPTDAILSRYDNLVNDLQNLQPFISAIYPLTVILLVDQGKIDDNDTPRDSIVAGSIHFAPARSANSTSIIEMMADHIRTIHQDENACVGRNLDTVQITADCQRDQV